MPLMKASLPTGSTLAALFVTVALVECGEGGGSSTPAAANPPLPALAPGFVNVKFASGNLRSTAVAWTYGLGSVSENHYTALNTALSAAAFGEGAASFKYGVETQGAPNVRH